MLPPKVNFFNMLIIIKLQKKERTTKAWALRDL